MKNLATHIYVKATVVTALASSLAIVLGGSRIP